MKGKILLISVILLIIIGVITGIIVYMNTNKTNYEKVYISSLEISGRLAEYKFKPNVNDVNGSYKIKLKVKDELKDKIRMSLYKIEDGKELNIKLNSNLETDKIDNLGQYEIKLVIYIERSYDLLDKDCINIAYLSI